MIEIIVDNFAGSGGASTGIEQAVGRPVDIAINHDPLAIAMHRANHPNTKHYCESVWDVDPVEASAGRPVGLAWFSPDCKHFSKAKGGKPVDKNIRGLAWVAVRWAETVRPRVIMLENVEEFKTWGPLKKNEKGELHPDPARAGETFDLFIAKLIKLGYQVDYRELRACDYGAPTIRKRFFLIARCDGKSIIWPEITHGDPSSLEVMSGLLKPWKTAANVIDWSIPCPSIFERKKELSPNTLRRIARGIEKFIINNPDPFVAPVVAAKDVYAPTLIQMGYGDPEGKRVLDLDKPIGTITAGGNKFAIATAVIARQFGQSIGHSLNDPLGTITAGGGGKSQLVTAFLAKDYGGNYKDPGSGIEEPLHTITTVDHNALVTGTLEQVEGVEDNSEKVYAFLMAYYGQSIGSSCSEPLQTVTTRDRFGLVTIKDRDYRIIDIGMRMLQPRELYNAHSFPSDYIIDRDADGNKITKKRQVHGVGNSVVVDIPKVLVRANLPDLCVIEVETSEAV